MRSFSVANITKNNNIQKNVFESGVYLVLELWKTRPPQPRFSRFRQCEPAKLIGQFKGVVNFALSDWTMPVNFFWTEGELLSCYDLV